MARTPPGIAWWIAIIVSSPFWIAWAWRGLKMLPIWGAKFQRHQRAEKIRLLETLHGDTNRLILHLTAEVMRMAVSFIGLIGSLAVAAVITGGTLTVSDVLIIMAMMLGSTVLVHIFQLRNLVLDLLHYEKAIADLKQKQGDAG